MASVTNTVQTASVDPVDGDNIIRRRPPCPSMEVTAYNEFRHKNTLCLRVESNPTAKQPFRFDDYKKYTIEEACVAAIGVLLHVQAEAMPNMDVEKAFDDVINYLAYRADNNPITF